LPYFIKGLRDDDWCLLWGAVHVILEGCALDWGVFFDDRLFVEDCIAFGIHLLYYIYFFAL
jgi:hypothetical protein